MKSKKAEKKKSITKAYKYRIYPTKKQEKLLVETLALCCELYNSGLQERRDAYRKHGLSISYNDQQNQLPDIKKDRPELTNIHSQVLQNALKRLDNAFAHFFRRVAKGEKAGYPRFRSRARYDSFTYPQDGYKISNGKLVLSKIGHLKIKVHRPLLGKVKTCQIKRMPTGKWFAIFTAEISPEPLPASQEATGIDAGLASFATLANGEKIDNPQFLRAEEKELAKVQKKLSATAKGSKERKRSRKIVARVHERISHKRENFAHQESRKIVNKYGIVVAEGLRIVNMMQNHCLAKSIADAAWSFFFHCLNYKAVCAGGKFVKVNPRNSSKACSKCGNLQDMALNVRIYRCANPLCNLVIDRDCNAALNILRLGLQTLGLRPIEAPA